MTIARVTVVGSCNVDLVARCATLPRAGETVAARSLTTVVGGKGANQAIAAARAGARTSMVGAVGDDANAALIRETLREAGVSTRGIRAVPGPSGTALIAVDDAGENSIVIVAGANGALVALEGGDLETVSDADVMLFQLEVPVSITCEAAQRARGLRVLNAAPAGVLPPELLADVDLLVVNETEAEALSPGSSRDPGLRGLVDLVPRVALTVGAEGVRYADRDGIRLRVRAPKVIAVDTTAAGDTFTGMLATALGERREIREALELACAAASLCVETLGASSSIPDRAATLARWSSAYPR